MSVSLLFWLGLLLPGYVVVRLVSPEDLKSGLMGTIGLSYLAVFGVLTPVSVVCYLFHLPVGVLSGTCVLIFGVAVVQIARRRWWLDLGKLLIAGLSVELLIVVVDLAMGSRVGSYLAGDAWVHVARIRFLVDHGFSNYEPFVAAKHFFPIYHTNLVHALHASCVRLTGVDFLSEWFISLVWAKLVIAAGCYYMGWCIFERRWAAWAVALFVVGRMAPVAFVGYPNKLAPLWLLPLMIGFVVQACRSPLGWRPALKLAVGSLVLAQTHGMYAVIAGLVLGPYLACVFLIRLTRRRADRWRLGACVAALFVAAPFVLIAHYKARPPSESMSPRIAKRFVHFENGWVMVKLKNPVSLELGALGALCCLAGARRRQAGVLAVSTATAALIMYVPPICTAAITASGVASTLLVYRMGCLITLGSSGLLVGGVVFLLEPAVRSRWLRALMSVCVVLLGGQLSSPKAPHDWSSYYQAAVSHSRREGWLASLHAQRTFFQRHIPAGATVLTDDRSEMWLVMCHDCYVILGGGRTPGVTDRPQRSRDKKTILAPDTPWDVRCEFLRKYDVNLFLVSQRKLDSIKWTQGHVRAYWKGPGYLLLSLATD